MIISRINILNNNNTNHICKNIFRYVLHSVNAPRKKRRKKRRRKKKRKKKKRKKKRKRKKRRRKKKILSEQKS